jgi:hypothetical protein
MPYSRMTTNEMQSVSDQAVRAPDVEFDSSIKKLLGWRNDSSGRISPQRGKQTRKTLTHRGDRERIGYLGKNPGGCDQALGAVLGGCQGSGVGAVFLSQKGDKIKGVGK